MDSKSENILVSDYLSAKISDFGTSRAKAEDDSAKMTAVGTPLFCAPEIMRGDIYDESVDVYSFGIVLLDIATDTEIVTFFTERYQIAFGTKKVPKIMKALRAISEDGWRPHRRSTIKIKSNHTIGEEPEDGMFFDEEQREVLEEVEPLNFAPMAIRSLIERCCDHDPRKRPSFAEIIDELAGPVTKEVEEASAPFVRHAASQASDDTAPSTTTSNLKNRLKKTQNRAASETAVAKALATDQAPDAGVGFIDRRGVDFGLGELRTAKVDNLEAKDLNSLSTTKQSWWPGSVI